MRFSYNFELQLKLHLLSRDDGGIGDEREVDPGVGHQVGLELSQVHVESSIKPEGSRDRRDNLPNELVKVVVRRTVNIKVPKL